MVRITLALSLLLLCPSFGAAQTAGQSKAVQKLLKTYTNEVAALEAEHVLKLKKKRKELLKLVKAELEKETKAGKLDQALRTRETVKQIESQTETENWMVRASRAFSENRLPKDMAGNWKGYWDGYGSYKIDFKVTGQKLVMKTPRLNDSLTFSAGRLVTQNESFEICPHPNGLLLIGWEGTSDRPDTQTKSRPRSFGFAWKK